MQRQIFVTLLGLGLLLKMAMPTAAEMDHPPTRHEFAKIDQPIGLKLGVMLGGLALIGLELWWFLPKQPQTQSSRLKRSKPTVKSK